jgi:1-acyl-sn-glycerol-3-phosphate acyltransferase
MLLKFIRIAVFIALNLICLPVGIIVNMILLPAGRLRARAQAVMTMIWAKASCLIFGIRVHRAGRCQKGGGFTVCNHAGYADVFALGSLRPTAFLSNHEVRRWPLFGWIAMLGGVVFVNRNSKRAALKAMQELEYKVKSDVTVIVFPEGTTSDGRTVRPFKSAFFNIPARHNIPVRPVGIRYSGLVADDVAWHGSAPMAAHFWRFAGLKRIDVTVNPGPLINPRFGDLSHIDARKRLRSLAHENVVSAFEAAGAAERKEHGKQEKS